MSPPPERRGSVASAASLRHETFTEAVPLALSSLAHASVFDHGRSSGVLDGIRQVVQHTLLQCVSYARAARPPPAADRDWTVRDLGVSRFAWVPAKEGSGGGGSAGARGPDGEVPFPLTKLQFRHCYSRNALIYLRPPPPHPYGMAAPATATTPESASADEELARVRDWARHDAALGRISLLYVTREPLTQEEMDGTERDDDTPACLLYKVLVEYRTLPPTGNQQATLAEELSMLSFGGSVDDDVKFGALASLYDEHAKYVLEVYSVRGKKYKFDLMDSTLSDGTIPTLPASRDGDPFVKSLCVTVTDHELYKHQTDGHGTEANGDRDKSALSVEAGNDTSGDGSRPTFAITRMNLLLEGKPRKGSDTSSILAFDDIVNAITDSFLLLNPQPTAIVTATQSGHALLLDPNLAGRVYINGRYLTTWGDDPRLASHGTALFGMDLQSIPIWHGRIVDYEAVKLAYASLWDEILVDARLIDLNIASQLLFRLMLGRDREEDEELYDFDNNMDAELESGESTADPSMDCLESQILSSIKYDPVGIAAKALTIRFGVEFGKDAFPCLLHEIDWVRTVLPHRTPVATPERLVKILRRGGYKNAQETVDELWFQNTRPPNKGPEQDIINDALQRLEQAGCEDVAMEQIYFTSAPVSGDFILKKMVCRYNAGEQSYYIHDKLFEITLNDFLDNENQAVVEPAKVKSYLLGMYIAEQHPDGRVLPRYLLRTSL